MTFESLNQRGDLLPTDLPFGLDRAKHWFSRDDIWMNPDRPQPRISEAGNTITLIERDRVHLFHK